jgi:tetratricopeptide (TPR) repeat protein
MVEKSEPGLVELLTLLETVQDRAFAFDGFDNCLALTMALDS